MNNFIHAITFIQKKFLLRKFLLEIKKCEDLFNKMNIYIKPPEYINYFNQEKQMDERFSELQNILMSKQNIDLVNSLLQLLYRCLGCDKKIAPKINSRKFMIGWMIISFPEFILNIKDPTKDEEKFKTIYQYPYPYPYDIYFISKELINRINALRQNEIKNINKEKIHHFKKSFNKYSNAINYFLQRDKSEQIQKLLNEFISINKTIKDIRNSERYPNIEYKEECIKTIILTKKKIASHLKKLDSNINIDDLEIQSQIHDAIENNMEKAICDILIDDIENKKFSYLSKFIDDIINQMINLGAKKVDDDFELKMNKDAIIQKIAYLEIEYQHIENYGDYIVDIINKLQAPISVSNTCDMWCDLKNECSEKNELLGKMIIFILKEIKMIYENIEDIKNANDLGFDIFKIR
jgi:hypothetical protein